MKFLSFSAQKAAGVPQPSTGTMEGTKLRSILLVALAFVVPTLQARPEAANTTGAPALMFDGPLVMKLNWDTSAPVAADLDGDQRTDLALINSNQARIELLYQLKPGEKIKPSARPISDSRWEPVLDDAPFQKASIVTGQTMHALAAGDFDSDGRMDLAYTNDQGRLVVLFQDADEGWTRKLEFELGENLPYDGTLVAENVDADEKTDLLVLTPKAICIYYQDEKGLSVKSQVRLPISESEGYELNFADVDGDRRKDIFHLGSGAPQSLYVRRQEEKGSFVLEELFDLEGTTRSEIVPVNYAAAAKGDQNSKRNAVSLLRVHDGTGLVELRKLETREDSSAVGLMTPFQRYAAPVQSLKATSFCVGNFGGVGGADVLLGDSEGAQVWLLEHRGAGRYKAPVSFPVYGGVSDLATLPAEKAGELDSVLVLSQREKTIGIMTRDGRDKSFAYPEPLRLDGTPLVAAVLREADAVRVACISEKDKKRQLEILEPGSGGFSAKAPLPLPSVASKPKALRPFDFNQDDRLDLLVFSPDEPLRVYLQATDGTFTEFTDPQGLSGSLVDKLDAASMTGADFDADGREELVIARKRFARALRIDAQNRVEVVGQFTADDELAELGFALLLPATNSAQGLIAYDANRGRILRAERDALGVFRQLASVEARLPKDPHVSLRGLQENFLLFIGGDSVHVARPGTERSLFGVEASHETDLDGVQYQNVLAAQLLPDSTQVIALDSVRSRVIEILDPPNQNRGRWKSLMHFRVFDQDPHYRGKTGSSEEPHAMLAADVTADGVTDLVMLVHDRLLLYPGKRK